MLGIFNKILGANLKFPIFSIFRSFLFVFMTAILLLLKMNFFLRLWGRRCDNLYSPTPAGNTQSGSPGSGSLPWTSLVSRSTTLTELGGPASGRWPQHPHTDEVYGFRYRVKRTELESQLSPIEYFLLIPPYCTFCILTRIFIFPISSLFFPYPLPSKLYSNSR